MLSLCLHFVVHQPYRVRRYRMFDVGKHHDYFSAADHSALDNHHMMHEAARTSYRPMGEVVSNLLKKHPSFRVALSFSGTALEQLERYDPITLRLFQDIVSTDRAEVLGGSYYHSPVFFYSLPEFERQVRAHEQAMEHFFGVAPQVFAGSSMGYSNELARWAEQEGYDGLLVKGAPELLEEYKPTYVYRPADTDRLNVLLTHRSLSEDLGKRFYDQSWSEWPLDSGTFARWIQAHKEDGQVITISTDHQSIKLNNGARDIFAFLDALPGALLSEPHIQFVTPSEVFQQTIAPDREHILDVADESVQSLYLAEGDLQRAALESVFALESAVLSSRSDEILEDWRRLQAVDHFHAMSNGDIVDGSLEYMQAHGSPYETYIAHQNAVQDLRSRLMLDVEPIYFDEPLRTLA